MENLYSFKHLVSNYLTLIIFILCSFFLLPTFSQTLYVDGGTSGIGNLSYSSGNVGIGTSVSSNAKLRIYNYSYQNTGSRSLTIDHYDPDNYFYQIGIDMYAKKQGSGGTLIGADWIVSNKSTGYTSTRGLDISATQYNTNQGTVYGIDVWASGGSTAYGIYASAYAPGGTDYAGYFSGDIRVTGMYISSDERLKHNVKRVDGALARLSKLNVKEFEYDQDTYGHMLLPRGKQVGFMAQEVEKYFPKLVKEAIHPASDSAVMEAGIQSYTKEVKYKTVNYIGLVPYLVQGIQEQDIAMKRMQKLLDVQNNLLKHQQQQLDSLQAQMKRLQKGIQEEESPVIPPIQVPLPPIPFPTFGSASLGQNYPNPTSDATIIPYELKDNIQQAHIVIRLVETGQVVKQVELAQRGKALVEVSLGHLAKGTYSYSLVADGQTISSKTLILTQ